MDRLILVGDVWQTGDGMLWFAYTRVGHVLLWNERGVQEVVAVFNKAHPEARRILCKKDIEGEN